MRSSSRKTACLLGVVAAAALGLSGCGGSDTSSAAEQVPPAAIGAPGPDGISQVKLTQQAAERIGLQTDTVREESVNGVTHKVIPYASVLYDATGETYAYANPEPLVFNRVKLVVDTVQGDLAVLSDGPAAGTKVVTAGATELFGAEFEVGGE